MDLSKRMMCLDVYRGLLVAGMILVDDPGNDEGACWPIMHAKWNGWTPADFIFPSFLFLVVGRVFGVFAGSGVDLLGIVVVFVEERRSS